jgi:hypothetical protein
MLSVAGDTTKLLTVSAACQGLEVKLETDIVNFGTVSLALPTPLLLRFLVSVSVPRFPTLLCTRLLCAARLCCRCVWAPKWSNWSPFTTRATLVPRWSGPKTRSPLTFQFPPPPRSCRRILKPGSSSRSTQRACPGTFGTRVFGAAWRVPTTSCSPCPENACHSPRARSRRCLLRVVCGRKSARRSVSGDVLKWGSLVLCTLSPSPICVVAMCVLSRIGDAAAVAPSGCFAPL